MTAVTITGGATEADTPTQKGVNQLPILIFGTICSGGRLSFRRKR
ncbi:MAG: hypothetical protein OPY07_03335 [Nitrosopumilus sp.]|nr:hypothetical protein [Nitrosopumilus sp.]